MLVVLVLTCVRTPAPSCPRRSVLVLLCGLVGCTGYVFANYARALPWDLSRGRPDLVNRVALRGKNYPLLLQQTQFAE